MAASIVYTVCLLDFGSFLFQWRSAETVYRHLHHPAKSINGFLCLLIVFLKSKTYQLILKDVIKLNRNLRKLIEIKLLLAIRTKWYWLKSIYLIKAVFNLSSQQTVINDNRSS